MPNSLHRVSLAITHSEKGLIIAVYFPLSIETCHVSWSVRRIGCRVCLTMTPTVFDVTFVMYRPSRLIKVCYRPSDHHLTAGGFYVPSATSAHTGQSHFAEYPREYTRRRNNVDMIFAAEAVSSVVLNKFLVAYFSPSPSIFGTRT
jgi:hypothetical protein